MYRRSRLHEDFLQGLGGEPLKPSASSRPPCCREEAVVRIYFHLKDAHEVLLDVEGVEVSDPHEARVQAALVIEELRPTDAQYWSGWTLTATAAGRVLFTVDLDSNVGSGLLSLLFLQGSELRHHLAYMLPDVFAGIARLV
jgi:hypothetical protein